MAFIMHNTNKPAQKHEVGSPAINCTDFFWQQKEAEPVTSM